VERPQTDPADVVRDATDLEPERLVRSAARRGRSEDTRSFGLGFRVARSLGN
jgi:hypothetical protein